jgi:hypothetical protein
MEFLRVSFNLSIAHFYFNYYILMSHNKKYCILGRQIPIDPTVEHLFPSVPLWDDMSVEANFGDNPAKPFEYDIRHCPGMGLEWI